MASPLYSFILLVFLSTAYSTDSSFYNYDSENRDPDYYDYEDLHIPIIMRVFDGVESNYKQQKHLVQLLIAKKFKNHRDIKFGACSASIISDRWILTAAHCFKADHKKYIISDQYVAVMRKEHENWVELGNAYKNIITHPNYVHDPEDPKLENDIAVIKTSKPIKLSEDLKPILLNTRPLELGKTITATIAGYGEAETSSSELAMPRQGLVTARFCPKSIGRNLLCSNNIVRAGPGDSGGSLVSKNGKLIGVSSASCTDVIVRKKCRTIYVEVTYYLKWIENITGIVY